MMNLRCAIENRIRKTCLDFKEVAGSADLVNVLAGRFADPGCYVFYDRTAAQSSESEAPIIQRVEMFVGVVIVVRNVRDSRGGDAADISWQLQNQIRKALLGWAVNADFDPVSYVGGNLINFDNGFHIWKDSFKTGLKIQSEFLDFDHVDDLADFATFNADYDIKPHDSREQHLHWLQEPPDYSESQPDLSDTTHLPI